MCSILNRSDIAFPVPFASEIDFTEDELKIFHDYMDVKPVKKRELLLKAGDEETTFRFLHKGLVRQFYLFNGKEINVNFSTKDEIVCSFASYTSHTPSKYFLEAVEPSMLFCFHKADMDFIISRGMKYTRFGKLLMTELCRQKEQREMDLLNYDALGRLQHFVTEKPELFLKLPQTYIASYLNIKPETLSTLKRKLVFTHSAAIDSLAVS
jgi:CRP-like cAMP-binding protein